MDELRQRIEELEEHWGNTYRKALSEKSSWERHLPNSSVEILNDAVAAIIIWLNSFQAPSGPSPGYRLGMSLAGVSLSQLITTTQSLEHGRYDLFPEFEKHLSALLSALHTMAVYSEKGAIKRANADMNANIVQTLALLKAAHSELAEKKRSLDAVEVLSGEIKEKHSEIDRLEGQCSESAETIASTLENVKREFNAIGKLLDGAKYHDEEFERLLSDNRSLNNNLKQMTDEILNLQQRCRKQEEIIDSVLPRGASAGLAAAFSQRVGQLEKGKWGWISLFVISVIGLSTFSYFCLTESLHSNQENFWAPILVRLPLVSPLIWLGWFSVIQYGNTIRLQEDYAFKEATSKAFQGYRDHMEHLEKISVEGASTALNLLSIKTIEILGHEPIRIFGKTENDAAPTSWIAKLWNSGKHGNNESR